MKMSKMMGLVAVAAVLGMSAVQAADEAGQLAQFKAGEISFTLLQADGVTPLQSAEMKMLSPEDSRVMAEAVSDQLGQAAVALSEGRYLLNVSGRTLSVLDVSADATLTACRVVIPAAAMMVAGQDEENDDAGSPAWLTPVVIGGVVVLAVVGGYAIYDNNNDDDDDGDNGDGTLPPPAGGGDRDDDDDNRRPSVL